MAPSWLAFFHPYYIFLGKSWGNKYSACICSSPYLHLPSSPYGSPWICCASLRRLISICPQSIEQPGVRKYMHTYRRVVEYKRRLSKCCKSVKRTPNWGTHELTDLYVYVMAHQLVASTFTKNANYWKGAGKRFVSSLRGECRRRGRAGQKWSDGWRVESCSWWGNENGTRGQQAFARSMKKLLSDPSAGRPLWTIRPNVVCWTVARQPAAVLAFSIIWANTNDQMALLARRCFAVFRNVFEWLAAT